MARHTKIGLIVSLAFILVIAPIGLFSENNQALTSIVQVFTWPALPVVYVLVQYFPPPMGESENTPWDYFMLSVAIFLSALVWGFFAGFISRHVKAKPHEHA